MLKRIVAMLCVGCAGLAVASQLTIQGDIDITNSVEHVENQSYRIDGAVNIGMVSDYSGTNISVGDLVFTESAWGDVDAWLITNVVAAGAINVSLDVEYDQSETTNRTGMTAGLAAFCAVTTNELALPLQPSFTGARVSWHMLNTIRNYALSKFGDYVPLTDYQTYTNQVSTSLTAHVSNEAPDVQHLTAAEKAIATNARVDSLNSVTGGLSLQDGTNTSIRIDGTNFYVDATGGGAGTLTNIISTDDSVQVTESGGPQPDLSVTNAVAWWSQYLPKQSVDYAGKNIFNVYQGYAEEWIVTNKNIGANPIKARWGACSDMDAVVMWPESGHRLQFLAVPGNTTGGYSIAISIESNGTIQLGGQLDLGGFSIMNIGTNSLHFADGTSISAKDWQDATSDKRRAEGPLAALIAFIMLWFKGNPRVLKILNILKKHLGLPVVIVLLTSGTAVAGEGITSTRILLWDSALSTNGGNMAGNIIMQGNDLTGAGSIEGTNGTFTNLVTETLQITGGSPTSGAVPVAVDNTGLVTWSVNFGNMDWTAYSFTNVSLNAWSSWQRALRYPSTIMPPKLVCAARTTLGATMSDSVKWQGGVLGPDGKIYGIPFGSTNILVIDTVAGTASRESMGLGDTMSDSSKWIGGVLGPDGKIYGIPRDSTNILVIDSSFIGYNEQLILSPYLNKF
jgi:hypothetical protein